MMLMFVAGMFINYIVWWLPYPIKRIMHQRKVVTTSAPDGNQCIHCVVAVHLSSWIQPFRGIKNLCFRGLDLICLGGPYAVLLYITSYTKFKINFRRVNVGVVHYDIVITAMYLSQVVRIIPTSEPSTLFPCLFPAVWCAVRIKDAIPVISTQ